MSRIEIDETLLFTVIASEVLDCSPLSSLIAYGVIDTLKARQAQLDKNKVKPTEVMSTEPTPTEPTVERRGDYIELNVPWRCQHLTPHEAMKLAHQLLLAVMPE